MTPDVPLVIPEVNADHLEILETQATRHSSGGYIVTNPNCSAIGLTLALKPLEKRFGIESLFVSTMQAISGAGYPGVPSLDILGNVIPFIKNEEEKLQEECGKLLGTIQGNTIEPLPARVSAHCNRVAVEDGHTECVSIKLKTPATEEQILAAWREFQPFGQNASQFGVRLPTAPISPVEYEPEHNRPQPRLDRMRGHGMAATVGRLRPCALFDWKFVVLSHNTIRGAAGAAVLNAEILAVLGKLDFKRFPRASAARRVLPRSRVGERVSTRPSVPAGTPRSNIVVMKFGGTSVEDATAILRTASIVAGRRAKGLSPVVVVSAMSKVTDQLLACAAAASAGRGEREPALEIAARLRTRHLNTADALVASNSIDRLTSLREDINRAFDSLDELVRGIAILGELTPRTSDLIVSYGERLSSVMVTAAFAEQGLPAAHLDAREVILTDDHFGKATPDEAAIERALTLKVLPLIDSGKIPVMGGFIGSHNEVTTTLGRGGSDYTGALVGGGLFAGAIEIWTDVDGIMTTDPRICPDALRVKTISLRRSRRARLLRRESPAPSHHPARSAEEHPRLGLEQPQSRKRGHRDHCDAAVLCEPVQVHRDQKAPDHHRYRRQPHAARARLSQARLRRLRQAQVRHRHGLHLGGLDLRDRRLARSPTRHLRRSLQAGRRKIRRQQGPRLPRRRRHPRPIRHRRPGLQLHLAHQRAHDLPGRQRDQHELHGQRRGRRVCGPRPPRPLLPLPGSGHLRRSSKVCHHSCLKEGSPRMRVLVLGAGKTGKLVASVASEHGHSVHVLDAKENKDASALTPPFVAGFDAVIDFTTPEAVIPNLRACLANGARVVVGTTGWYAGLPEAKALAERRGASLLYGTNFSIGVQIMFKLAAEMTKELKRFGYTFAISETHHVTKLDAPSGTALTLRDCVRKAADMDDVSIESVRHGEAVGLHVLEATGAGDKLLLTHQSHSRRAFAEGAVRAAEWLARNKPGIYDFRDIYEKL